MLCICDDKWIRSACITSNRSSKIMSRKNKDLRKEININGTTLYVFLWVSHIALELPRENTWIRKKFAHLIKIPVVWKEWIELGRG
jgi:hypothetical protein